ncbi:putative nuclease HARBI1 [Chanodichthys erythropterus]|uniref:putative nuclease HARBI1 n=1 Tax=Chanodichthys erythropterus TaxID=933992 RepID=UPI00351DF5A4
MEVLVFVYWFAHALSYRVTSRTFSFPKSTVCRIVHKIGHQIKNVVAAGRVICYPLPGQLYGVGHGFAQLAQHAAFQKAVGAVDGCHIRIKPPGRNKEDYFNYKQFYSIQMQAVCDSTGRFLNIFVGYPGSVHDTRIFKNSPLYYNAEYPPPGYFLLGDGGYPCIDTPICVITPFKMPLQGPVQERFSRCHSRGHTIIERAFGMMKARWRRTLFSALKVKVGFCTKVVIACAFLHNVCLTHGDVLEPEDAEDADATSPPSPDAAVFVDRSGVQFRDRLAARVSAPVGVQRPLMEHDYTL